MRLFLWCGVWFYVSLGSVCGLFFLLLLLILSVENHPFIWLESGRQWGYFLLQFTYFFCFLASFLLIRRWRRQGQWLSLILSGYTPLFLSICFSFWGFTAGAIGFEILSVGLEDWRVDSDRAGWIPWQSGYIHLQSEYFFNGHTLESVEMNQEILQCLAQPFWCRSSVLVSNHSPLMTEWYRRLLVFFLTPLGCFSAIYWREKSYLILSSALILVLIQLYYWQLL